MKVGELIRKIADITDIANDVQSLSTQDDNFEPNTVPASDSEIVDNGPDKDNPETATMVPPLQQKHELLKKTANVDNNVDSFSDEDDELEALKRAAGIYDISDTEMDILGQSLEVNPKKNAALAHFRTDTPGEE